MPQRQTLAVALLVAGAILAAVGALPGLVAGVAIAVAGVIVFFRSRQSPPPAE